MSDAGTVRILGIAGSLRRGSFNAATLRTAQELAPADMTIENFDIAPIPLYNEDGRHRVDYVEGQDMMAWVTQGPITDRTVEHLGRSDVGVTMLRRMFKEQMARVSRGEDPLGVYRDFRDRIDLPCEKNKFDAGGSFAIEFIERASSRFSPQADALKKLHIKAHENRKAAAG